jgi:phage terminase large subunit
MIKEKEILTNKVFRELEKNTNRIQIHQGGTRSGKTYNILLWIIFSYCQQNKGKTVTICRKTFPALRATVMRDFFDILKTHEMYNEEVHQLTTSEYFFNTNRIEFISLDAPTKIRGRKRDLLFVNEGNELIWEDWKQLLFRTKDRIILDFNPSDEFHWLYDKVMTRDDATLCISTYKDNPFLGKEIVEEIERLRDTDINAWNVYGLGQRGQNRSLVFQFQTTEAIPEQAKLISYGLDFGFTNDATSMVASYLLGDSIYIKELLYRTNMTNSDIADHFGSLGLDRRDEIFCDSAEPKSVEELHRLGWNTKSTYKGEINLGIDILRRYKLIVLDTSLNVIKEMRNYKFIEDKNGNLTNKPEDKFNHSLDALRYSVLNKLSRPNYGKYAVR